MLPTNESSLFFSPVLIFTVQFSSCGCVRAVWCGSARLCRIVRTAHSPRSTFDCLFALGRRYNLTMNRRVFALQKVGNSILPHPYLGPLLTYSKSTETIWIDRNGVLVREQLTHINLGK